MALKKLIIVFDEIDSSKIDFNSLMALAKDIKIETIVGKTEEPIPPRTLNRRTDMTTESCIMMHFSPNATFENRHAEAWLKAYEYSPNSAGPCLGKLVAQGLIRTLGKSKWQFIKPKDGVKLLGPQPPINHGNHK